jgi:hemoglobin
MSEARTERPVGACADLDPGADAPRIASEADIVALVRRFYALALADDLLGPMFRAELADFDAHHTIVEDFWSHSLLGTDRYQRGTPYSHHTHLKVEPAHFDRWMAAFTAAAEEALPPAAAALALKRAAHMTTSFKAGMLPLPAPRPQPPAPGG